MFGQRYIITSMTLDWRPYPLVLTLLGCVGLGLIDLYVGLRSIGGIQPLGVIALWAMRMIERRDTPDKVQYRVVHRSDSLSLEDKESLPKTTLIAFPHVPDPTSWCCCYSSTINHDTDSILTISNWGVPDPSRGGSIEDWGAPQKEFNASVVPGPPFSPTPSSPIVIALVVPESPPTSPTLAVFYRSYTALAFPCRLLPFWVYIHHSVLLFFSSYTLYFYFKKEHLPYYFVLMIIVDFILQYFYYYCI